MCNIFVSSDDLPSVRVATSLEAALKCGQPSLLRQQCGHARVLTPERFDSTVMEMFFGIIRLSGKNCFDRHGKTIRPSWINGPVRVSRTVQSNSQVIHKRHPTVEKKKNTSVENFLTVERLFRPSWIFFSTVTGKSFRQSEKLSTVKKKSMSWRVMSLQSPTRTFLEHL